MTEKNVFWHAFIVTIIIFGLGVFIGIIIENWRTSKINDLYQKSEIDLLDVKLQAEIYSLKDFDCTEAIRENIAFADRIYNEAKILDRYERSSRLTEDLIIEHKKYDLLRTMLWLNSIKIKEKCGEYYEVVYLYKYNEPSFEVRAKQNVFSKLLTELKEIKGEKVLLIPISGDNDFSAVNLLLEKYEIKKTELPVILIDRKIKITEIQTIEELLKYFK